MLKQPPDCVRACWLGCGSLPGWCSWSVNIIIIYQQPSHHSRVPLILLLLLLLSSAAVLYSCPCTALFLLHLHTTIHPRHSRPACAAYLNPADLIPYTHHSPPQNCWSPTALARATPKKKRSPSLLLSASHTTIRTPLIKIPPSRRFFHLPRHRLHHHHLPVTLTLLPAPAVSRAFLFSPRTRLIPAHLFHDLCCCKDGRRCERSFIEAQWTRQWRS